MTESLELPFWLELVTAALLLIGQGGGLPGEFETPFRSAAAALALSERDPGAAREHAATALTAPADAATTTVAATTTATRSSGPIHYDDGAVAVPIQPQAQEQTNWCWAATGGTIAAYARYVRSSMVDNLNEQYVRTARAKGLSEFRVVFVHTLRNAMFPVITMIGLYIPAMFCGALVIETLFNFNGMGYMYYQATGRRDYPILLGVALIVSFATVIGALLADFLYALADPRIRLAGRAK